MEPAKAETAMKGQRAARRAGAVREVLGVHVHHVDRDPLLGKDHAYPMAIRTQGIGE